MYDAAPEHEYGSPPALSPAQLIDVARAAGLSWEAAASRLNLPLTPDELRRACLDDPGYDEAYERADRDHDREADAELRASARPCATPTRPRAPAPAPAPAPRSDSGRRMARYAGCERLYG